jgi:PAS domain S-box-containing protein
MSAFPDRRPPQAVRTSGTGDDRFERLVESIRDYAIVLLDPDGRIGTWNAGAQRLSGYQAKEIIGQHFSCFYPPGDLVAGKPARVLAIARETGRYEEECWRVRKDGAHFWASVVLTAMRGDDGVLWGFSKVTRDITEKKELLERAQAHALEAETRSAELERLTSELREANSAMESFTYSVSHDLRAPLRAMWGFATALQEDYGEHLDEQGRRYAQSVVDAARRMDALVEDLLAYSQLSRVEMELGPTELEGAVHEAVQEVGPGGKGCEESVTVTLPLAPVIGHRATLVQVLINLLSNALKFVAPGTEPQVRVFAEARGGRVRLWVDDNGLGIASEHHKRIFLPFERLHGLELYPGTGIGLAIVRKGVERMGGSAGVDSELGRGSRFWIELPAAADGQ